MYFVHANTRNHLFPILSIHIFNHSSASSSQNLYIEMIRLAAPKCTNTEFYFVSHKGATFGKQNSLRQTKILTIVGME